jgi:hypothetical protein
MASNTAATHKNSLLPPSPPLTPSFPPPLTPLDVDMSFLDAPLPIDWSKFKDLPPLYLNKEPTPPSSNIFLHGNMIPIDISFCETVCSFTVVKSKFVSCYPCSHIFCDECLEFHFKTYQAFFCPICGQKIENLTSKGKNLRSMVMLNASKIMLPRMK